MEDEIIAANIVKDMDHKYFHFIDADGNLKRRLKSGIKKKNTGKRNVKYFNNLNLTLNATLLKSYISLTEKKVIATGKSGAMISMPKAWIGFKGRLILIPSEAINDVYDNKLNLF